MTPRRLPLLAAFMLAGCASSPPLRSPVPIAPRDGETVRGFPRTIRFEWEPVAGARTYALEVDCMHCCRRDAWCSEVGGSTTVVRGLEQPSHTLNYVGDQPGRWRVWAERRGAPGLKSEWREFVSRSRSEEVERRIEQRAFGPRPPLPDGSVLPRAIHHPNPPYPSSAIRSRTSGEVVLRVLVGADGLVKDVEVLRPLHPDLDESAVGTARTWRFEAGRTPDGRPVESWLTVVMTFKVQ